METYQNVVDTQNIYLIFWIRKCAQSNIQLINVITHTLYIKSNRQSSKMEYHHDSRRHENLT